MELEDHYIKCPHCGCQTDIDPALVEPDAPVLYCPECDEPLFNLDSLIWEDEKTEP